MPRGIYDRKDRGGRVHLYVALESFLDPRTYEQVNRGDLVREGHPLLKKHPAMFGLADEHVRFDIEAATAAPGERR